MYGEIPYMGSRLLLQPKTSITRLQQVLMGMAVHMLLLDKCELRLLAANALCV